MEDLTFGEQVKIVLGRKGMTIKNWRRQLRKRQERRCPVRI